MTADSFETLMEMIFQQKQKLHISTTHHNGLFTRPISECDFALRWFVLEKTNL